VSSFLNTRPNSAYSTGLFATVVVGSIVVAGGRGDWNRFVDAGSSMVGRHGWNVFANNGDIQTGPLSLAIARMLAFTTSNGFPVAVGLCTLLGLWILRTLRASQPAGLEAPGNYVALIGPVLLMFTWAKLGAYGHLDDAMVLSAGVTATCMVRTQRKMPAAVLIGLAIAVKPWAVILIPLTFCRSGSWRKRIEGPLVSALVGAALWAPFLIFAPDTIRSMRPTVNVAADSVLRLLGVHGSDLPASLRTLQLGAAFVVALVAVWRGRTSGVLLAAISARLMLDPGTWSYYTPGLVVGALVWDTFERRRRLPWTTIAATLLLAPAWIDPLANLRAWLRLAACFASIGVVLTSRGSEGLLHDWTLTEPSPRADRLSPSQGRTVSG